MENLDYINEYSEFEKNFRLTEVSPEQVGELVMRMAGHFIRYNVRMGDALRAFSVVKAGFQNQVDATSGKPMSSAKADTLSDATEEAAKYEMARIHVTNIQEIINALKCLQKGVLGEYANSN